MDTIDWVSSNRLGNVPSAKGSTRSGDMTKRRRFCLYSSSFSPTVGRLCSAKGS